VREQNDNSHYARPALARFKGRARLVECRRHELRETADGREQRVLPSALCRLLSAVFSSLPSAV